MKTTMLSSVLAAAVLVATPVRAQQATVSAPGQPTASTGSEPTAAAGDKTEPGDGQPAQKAAAADDDDPDLDVNASQPDFTLATLPTTLRMPKGKFAFRVTHRFARPLDQGNFGDLVEDLFGFDSGGLIGLEVRYGLFHGTQIGVLRTSDRTIELFGQQQITAQSESFPLGLAVNVTMDGTNNFTDSYSPGIGLIVSREIGTHGALYVEPTWVNNTNLLPSEVVDDNDAFLLGLGARVRVSRRAYLVAEAAPRVAGFDPGSTHMSFGVEMRAGGHAFQLNFSRGLETTMGQVARGGTEDNWFIGFNISRKFW